MMVQLAINELGRRIGDSHQNAKLTNRDVELIFELREQGFTYKQIAEKFEVSFSQVRNILKGLKRSQLVCKWKVLHL